MSAKLATNDLEAFWMPFTANRQYKRAPRLFVSAERMHFTTDDGRKVLDGTSGLWCVNAGHCRPKIVEAIRKQVGELDFAGTFQMGHPRAFECASKLVNIAPPGFDHVFFTNSGSEFGRDRAQDRARLSPGERQRLEDAADRPRARLSRRQFRRHLCRRHRQQPQMVRHACSPASTISATPTTSARNAFSRGEPEHGAELADDLERLVALHDASTIAAVIVEPVACSAGVLVPPKGYLKRLAAICAKHDILLILDEVITAFGRLGTPFGADYFGVSPDIITTAKGITNGAIPMGAVFVKGKIHDAFMGGAGGGDRSLPRLHLFGPPRCLRRLHRDARGLQGGGLAHARCGACALLAGGGAFAEGPAARHRHPQYRADRRHRVRADTRRSRRKRAHARFVEAFNRGLLVRATGDIIALSPPLIIEKKEIDQLIDILSGVLKSAN